MIESKIADIRISFIIPVYNRPDEIKELLESMVQQTVNTFEIIIVEDGSDNKCDRICQEFQHKLDLKYFYKENSGPGQSRNYGYEKAKGNYCIFLDSDCVLPQDYFRIVQSVLNEDYVDAFGGPDRAHSDFSILQKAINYSMTSFFTTGGIRGSSEKLNKFHPRSFNMGYSRTVFDTTQGFSKMRFGEDIDMSIRILQNGFKTRLIKDAYVYHKRRTNLRQFFKQVFNSGIARINLYKRHPKSLKIIHLAPAIFTLGSICLLVISIVYSVFFLLPNLVHILIIFLDSSLRNKSITIGMLSIATSYTQLFGYGSGFIIATWKRIILNQKEYAAYIDNFYE
ncbi:MAG: glycosyltransferase [Saprospiraceae bacterium]|nr:glycosyltransferase [Saprospiraceae bacterium]